MLPIPIFWTNYTATVSGRLVKLVPCENCQTEYVYLLKRESESVGTSLYCLNDEGAQAEAVSSAEEGLRDYLANDFDPVPCPVCGHYQKYMFPKLDVTRSPWMHAASIVVFVAVTLSAVSAVFWGISYLEFPTDHKLGRLGLACSVLAVASLIGVGLVAAERARARRFDPNMEEQKARIEKGRSRAVTRAEFEARQQRRAAPSRSPESPRGPGEFENEKNSKPA